MKRAPIALLGFFVMLPSLASAVSITVTVNGMVCAFCAQGIEKKFKGEDSVRTVKVDLDQKRVDLELKDGKQLDDKKILQIVSESGFALKKVERR